MDSPHTFLQVVYDETDVCPYLPDQTARMPLEVPRQPLTPELFEELLASGYRRTGHFFYQTRCPRCQACEALRLDLEEFVPSRSQKRALKLGDKELEMRVSVPVVDDRRVELFNQHRASRDLDHGGPGIDYRDYEGFLLTSTVEVIELAFYHADRLVAVSITDVAAESLSAVYCYFDPEYSRLSPGTYAIMKQVELGRKYGLKQLYLGLYVEGNSHLNYKARYRPHQRLQDGSWRDFT